LTRGLVDCYYLVIPKAGPKSLPTIIDNNKSQNLHKMSSRRNPQTDQFAERVVRVLKCFAETYSASHNRRTDNIIEDLRKKFIKAGSGATDFKIDLETIGEKIDGFFMATLNLLEDLTEDYSERRVLLSRIANTLEEHLTSTGFLFKQSLAKTPLTETWSKKIEAWSKKVKKKFKLD
jgi:hypothetical protein